MEYIFYYLHSHEQHTFYFRSVYYLVKYTEMQKNLYTTLGTQQFAEEIAQRIADQD